MVKQGDTDFSTEEQIALGKLCIIEKLDQRYLYSLLEPLRQKCPGRGLKLRPPAPLAKGRSNTIYAGIFPAFLGDSPPPPPLHTYIYA